MASRVYVGSRNRLGEGTDPWQGVGDGLPQTQERINSGYIGAPQPGLRTALNIPIPNRAPISTPTPQPTLSSPSLPNPISGRRSDLIGPSAFDSGWRTQAKDAVNTFRNSLPTSLGTTPTTSYTEVSRAPNYTPQALNTSYNETSRTPSYTPQALDTSYDDRDLDFSRNLRDVSVSSGGPGASGRRDLFTNPEWVMNAAGYDPREIIGARLGQEDYFTNAEDQISGGLRGFDQLEEIARTGGYNDSIRDMIRSRSSSPALSAMGDVLRQQNRAQTIGNYNVPGMQDAQNYMNNRTLMSALGDIGRSTEIDLAERALQNRLGAANSLGSLDLARANALFGVASQRLARDEGIFDRMEGARRFNQSEDSAAKSREQQALEANAARQAAASALQAQLNTQMNLAENQFALGRAGLQESGNQRRSSHALGTGALTNNANQIASSYDLGLGSLNNQANQIRSSHALGAGALTNNANQIASAYDLGLGNLNEIGNQRRANVGMFDANLGEQGRQYDNSLRQGDRQFLADLGVKSALGTGALDLQQRGQDQQYDLGWGQLGLGKYGIDMGDALSRYGIDKNDALSRYGIDTQADVSRHGIDTQAGQQSAERKSNWWNKILGGALMGLGGMFGAGAVTTPLGLGMMRG